jgi:hypothetical protein
MDKRVIFTLMFTVLASCAFQKVNLVESRPEKCVKLGELYDWNPLVRDSIEIMRSKAAKIGGKGGSIFL